MDQFFHVVVLSFWAAILGLIVVHAGDFSTLVGKVGDEWVGLINAVQGR